MKGFGSIRARLLYGVTAVALLPLLVAAAVISTLAYRDARESLVERAQAQLTSIQSIKRDEVSGYFGLLQSTVRVAAANPTIVDSMIALRDAMPSVATDVPVSIDEQRAALRAYYAGDFAQQYSVKNPGSTIDITDRISQLSDVAVAMQYLYITANPNPLGQKGLMDRAPNVTGPYHDLHQKVHPVGASLVEQYGFYDVFLIDAATGDVVYTYYKELDFATSLKTGPFAGSGLAKAWERAAALGTSTEPQITDFEKYLPSYDDGAAFFSIPLLRNGQVVGIFAAQVPVDRFHAIVSFQGQWGNAGLGQTGEVSLVGSDRLLRSNARGIQQDTNAYIAALRGSGADAAAVAGIEARKNTIGLVEVATDGVTRALNGENGVETYKNKFGTPVIGAFAPFPLLGLNWAITAEIDEAEALRPVEDLLQRMLIAAAITALILALLASLIATRLARGINTPIEQLSSTVGLLTAGNMDARAGLKGSDELSDLGNAFDKLLDERVATMAAAERENDQLNESVITIMQSVSQLAQNDLTVRVPVTPDVTGTVSDAINLLVQETSSALRNVTGVANQVAQSSIALRTRTATVYESAQDSEREVTSASNELKAAATALATVARDAAGARGKAEDALRASAQGLAIVSDTVAGVAASREQIRETEKRVKRLAERSNEISGVINIINQIAERTAILALNAGMQAAAAGDAGRGFAVVADEVKRLADSARGATSQITTLVSGIQADASDTMRSMNEALSRFVEINRLAEQAGEEVQTSMTATDALTEAVRQIAETSGEQATISDTLVERAGRIDASTRNVLKELQLQRDNVQALLVQAKSLIDTVRVFKLPS